MKLLEDRIRKDGIIREGNVLKVDSFINHQMDIKLFEEMAKEWKRLFADKKINKILTIEASGIGIAAIVAREFDVPVVFAKKSKSINLDDNNFSTKIQSFTHSKSSYLQRIIFLLLMISLQMDVHYLVLLTLLKVQVQPLKVSVLRLKRVSSRVERL